MSYEIIIMILIILSSLAVGIWLVIHLINLISNKLRKKYFAQTLEGSALVTLLEQGSKILVSIILINFLVPYLPISSTYIEAAGKMTKILLIIALAWIIINAFHTIKLYLFRKYTQELPDTLQHKKIYTQITVIERIFITLVVVVSAAIILMTFDRMRELGGTLLASAGLVAAVTTFAANKTLSSIIAGFQIAMTQPIRINDSVVVENEFGTVEDITLTYVVIKLWDLRRLILPINYFMEKPFQNWTLESKNLIGVLLLHFDYSLPINELRQYFTSIIKEASLWDKKVANLQVSDSTDKTIEVRVLVSAANAGDLWDLRCEIREKIIKFVQEKYPSCLPQFRINKEGFIDSKLG